MVRKVSVLFLLLATVFVFAGYAEAARQTFGGAFSVDVPSGWQVEEEEEDGAHMFSFTAPDNSARLSIIAGENEEGFTAEEVATGFAEMFGGSKPEKDADGNFTFTFKNENGVDGTAFITVDKESVVIFLVEGEHPQMGDLLGSFQLVE